MTAQKASFNASPTSSRSGSRLVVEFATLRRFTKYEPSEIGSLLTDASARLAVAMEDLQNFSPYLTDKEFAPLVDQCNDLTQLVAQEMRKLAAKKASVVKRKKFQAMVEAVEEYEERCTLAASLVKRASKAAQERATEEKYRTGRCHRPSRDEMERRIEHIKKVWTALRGAHPTLSLPEDTRELADIVDELFNFLDMQNGTMEDDLSDVDPKIRPLVARLRPLLRNLPEYRKLVACQDETAERLLDMFQELLNILDGSLPGFRSHLLVATQRLAYNSGRYPTSYRLRNVTTTGEPPVCQGGFAEIWRGYSHRQTVCLKAVKPEGNQWRKAIAKESILWGQLSHPNVLPFYGLFEFNGKPALVSPWVDHNLPQYLKEKPLANRLLLALDVVEGLRFLHKRKIVHGDLKGANILVTHSGRACLADFGVSSVLCPDVTILSTVSSVDSQGGTLLWQSPELMEDPRNTKASDMYAWACVAYEIFVGEVPYYHLLHRLSHNPDVIKKEVKSGKQPLRPPESSPSWTAWGLTKKIWTLMEECWAATPAVRPTSDEVADGLTSMLRPEDKKLERESLGSIARYRQEARAGSPRHVELTVEVFNSLVGFSNQNEVRV